MTTRTHDILLQLGFAQADTRGTHLMPGTLAHPFPGWELHALECIGRDYTPIILFTGVAADARTIAMIEFEMPCEVESFEQGVAWLAFMLERQAKRFLDPNIPAWFELGRANRSSLPWERRQAEYVARPLCFVGRDWMRLVLRELRSAVAESSSEDRIQFSFDGEMFRIRGETFVTGAPAEGRGWERTFSVASPSLQRLPKRLMLSSIAVDVWDGRLVMARHAYPVVD